MTVLDIVKAGITIATIAFVALFGFTIPIYIFKKKKADEDYDAENVWGIGAVGIFAFLLLCTVCTFFSAFIFNSPIFVFAAGALFLVLLISFFFATDSAIDEEETYLYSIFSAMICFGVALLLVLLAGLQEQQKAEREAENTQYNQTVTFYLDANDNKVDTGSYSYPVNSLRTNNTGDTYTWVERKADGNLTARTVQKVPDSTYEVILRDDLPATDTEPRVERSVEYQVKGEEVNAGKEPCASRYDSKELTNYLPACDKDKTRARLTKVRTIIHVPAGSFDKLVTVTSE